MAAAKAAPMSRRQQTLCGLDPHKTLHGTQDLRLLLLRCAAQKMWTESTSSWWSSFFADVKMPVNRCHHTSQMSSHLSGVPRVCSGVLKGMWLACPVVKNECEKSQMPTAAVREQLMEGIRQLLFRDSHAMLLYRCSWNVIHEV